MVVVGVGRLCDDVITEAIVLTSVGRFANGRAVTGFPSNHAHQMAAVCFKPGRARSFAQIFEVCLRKTRRRSADLADAPRSWTPRVRHAAALAIARRGFNEPAKCGGADSALVDCARFGLLRLRGNSGGTTVGGKS